VAPERGVWIDKFRVEVCQTVWVGHLDLTPEDLIDPRARAVLIPALTTDEGENGTRRSQARGLTFRVAGRALPPELRDLGLQLSDDEFKLEPRAGRLPSERAWFSTSALRSEDHLRLLEELERAYRT
jgi:hypothetical protein